MARAFDISPTATNAVQYIQRIFLTQNGDSNSLTQITLDGTNGNWTFAGSLGADTVTATTVNGTIINGTTLSGTNIKGTTITGSTICLANDTSSDKCRTIWPTGAAASAGGWESIWSTWAGGAAYYNSGNVGIGTGNPWAKLHVNWDIRWFNSLLISDDDNTFGEINTIWWNAFLRLNTEENYFNIINTQYTDSLFTEQAVRLRSYGLLFPMIFWTDNTERMRIAANGYVGIGATGPTEQLQIGNYTWLGQNVSATSGAWGTFLRMNWVDPYNYNWTIQQNTGDGSVSERFTAVVNRVNAYIGDPDYSPNIQLNYKWHNGATNYVENWKLIGGRQNFFLHHGDWTALPNEILAISTIWDMQLTNTNWLWNLYFANGKISVWPTTSTKRVYMSVDNTGWKIGYGASNNQIYLKSDGNVGIWTNLASTKLYVQWDVTANAYYYSSDKRLKTDITAISDPLQKILNLNGYTFTWKDSGKKDMWVIAQEVEQIFPEIVNTNTEWYKSVEYGNLVAPLIEAVKILNAKVDAQAKEIETLKAMIK